MALNVNIIGRDSEGNLRALKVNSEGNLEVADIAGIKTAIESLDNKELATELTLAQILTILGGTAADIGTLKLENGQIKGYDGTDWQPVRVNDAGELILASEVTVNAEGLSVDLGKLVLQAKNPSGVPVDMKSDTEGNLKVSLSGNIVETLDAGVTVPYDYAHIGLLGTGGKYFGHRSNGIDLDRVTWIEKYGKIIILIHNNLNVALTGRVHLSAKETPTGAFYSQHYYGKAVDIESVPAKAYMPLILDNVQIFRYLTISMSASDPTEGEIKIDYVGCY